MKFNFLKEMPKEANSNIFDTFGFFENKFFVSKDSSAILVFNKEIEGDFSDVAYVFHRYDFLKALKNKIEADVNPVENSSSVLTEISRAFSHIGEDHNCCINASKIPNPVTTVGNGNCSTAFIIKNGRLYAAAPGFTITVISALSDSVETSDRSYTLNFLQTNLIKSTFSGEAHICFNADHIYIFDSEKTLILKEKKYEGGYIYYPEIFNIINSVKKPKTIKKESFEEVFADYDFNDFADSCNPLVERINCPSYKFCLDGEKINATFSEEEEANNYLAKGRSGETLFNASFPTAMGLYNSFNGSNINYICWDPEKMSAENVDKNWWDRKKSIFFNDEKDTAVYMPKFDD